MPKRTNKDISEALTREDPKRYDPLSQAERSERMSRIHHVDTKPELVVRRLIHGMGYRYRLHAKDLPGHPDLIFRSRRKVIFVHGCFWHQHGCRQYRMPKSRLDFWGPKLKKNIERDRKAHDALIDAGWDVHIIWECEIKDQELLRKRVRNFLEGD